jgi:hypothetical protein
MSFHILKVDTFSKRNHQDKKNISIIILVSLFLFSSNIIDNFQIYNKYNNNSKLKTIHLCLFF